MIEHAFANRTDTLATWGLLQVNCLLIKAEEEQERRARQGSSTLTRRLRQARAAKEEANKADAGEKKSVIRRLPQARKAHEQAAKARKEEQAGQSGDEGIAGPSLAQPAHSPDYLQPVSRPGFTGGGYVSNESRPDTIGLSDVAMEAPSTSFSSPLPAREARNPCWLTVRDSHRHIALPAAGELVLGRFDASFGIPPDIDLAYEDKNQGTVSRRHAKIVGRNGYHTIEDTGSRHGVFVNGDRIKPGFSHPIKPGDRIAIGGVQMSYSEVPAHLQNVSQLPQAHHMLIVTPTGRRVPIAPPHDVIIGRSDRYVDMVPDIDLGEDGEVAVRVSRRHATIHWRNGEPYLEDLGSGFGTRVNGKMVLLGQAVPLRPGDHIWLGGCVLAYDVD